ncbi:uncharacterized protein LOC110604835 [Manihot esculenta]|uniref:uncharacterized protein LOC110604835 n=1 Tax=Manihot esculenta TaxID=3983 RepID=UPI000B5D8F0E|nr:uncharacterized protein LOC110604835 [Manihot esculenta]
MVAYDGIGNSREHVLNYKTFMKLQTHSDALMCKVFLTTLIGPVRAWFIAGVPAERKTSYLETIRQRRNESLREYVTKFNSEALQIPELDEGKAVEAIQKGTTSLEFFGLLCRKLLTTLVELMKRAEKYIRQDDALTTSRFAKEAGDRGKIGEDKRPDRQERRQDQGSEVLNKHWRERKEQRPYQPLISEMITPMNVSRTEVLVVI